MATKAGGEEMSLCAFKNQTLYNRKNRLVLSSRPSNPGKRFVKTGENVRDGGEGGALLGLCSGPGGGIRTSLPGFTYSRWLEHFLVSSRFLGDTEEGTS